MLLFPMVNSVLAVKMNIKLKTYYSNTAVRYTGVPKTIRRYGTLLFLIFEELKIIINNMSSYFSFITF